jgi:hypothetical protein
MQKETPTPTHEVSFTDGNQILGSIAVIVMEPTEDEDMLEAGAVGQAAVEHMQVVVRRVKDGHEETFDSAETREWWA